MVTGGWIQRYHNYTTTCAWSIPLWIKNLKEKREEMIHDYTNTKIKLLFILFLKLYVVPGYPVYRYPVLVDTVYGTLYTSTLDN